MHAEVKARPTGTVFSLLQRKPITPPAVVQFGFVDPSPATCVMSGPRRSDFGGGHDIVAEQPVSGLAQFFLQKAKANAKMSLAEALVSFFKETKGVGQRKLFLSTQECVFQGFASQWPVQGPRPKKLGPGHNHSMFQVLEGIGLSEIVLKPRRQQVILHCCYRPARLSCNLDAMAARRIGQRRSRPTWTSTR